MPTGQELALRRLSLLVCCYGRAGPACSQQRCAHQSAPARRRRWNLPMGSKPNAPAPAGAAGSRQTVGTFQAGQTLWGAEAELKRLHADSHRSSPKYVCAKAGLGPGWRSTIPLNPMDEHPMTSSDATSLRHLHYMGIGLTAPCAGHS